MSLLALQEANDLPGTLIQIRRALRPDGLFAPFTVNTLPDSTLQAVADHGSLPERPLPEDGVDAEEVLDAYEKAGTDVDALAAELQRKGADAFVASWTALLETIASKRAALAGAS